MFGRDRGHRRLLMLASRVKVRVNAVRTISCVLSLMRQCDSGAAVATFNLRRAVSLVRCRPASPMQRETMTDDRRALLS